MFLLKWIHADGIGLLVWRQHFLRLESMIYRRYGCTVWLNLFHWQLSVWGSIICIVADIEELWLSEMFGSCSCSGQKFHPVQIHWVLDCKLSEGAWFRQLELILIIRLRFILPELKTLMINFKLFVIQVFNIQKWTLIILSLTLSLITGQDVKDVQVLTWGPIPVDWPRNCNPRGILRPRFISTWTRVLLVDYRTPTSEVIFIYICHGTVDLL